MDLAGFEPAASSVRLRRAPAALQAPSGVPKWAVAIVLERTGGVKQRHFEGQNPRIAFLTSLNNGQMLEEGASTRFEGIFFIALIRRFACGNGQDYNRTTLGGCYARRSGKEA